MLDRAAIIDGDLPCPPWSSSNDIDAALGSLAAASKKTGWAACSSVLFAIGNPHARTYWPAVLSVIPRLGAILYEGGAISRARTLNVLIDLLLFFDPERGFEIVETPDGPRDLAYLVREEIAGLSFAAEALASSAEASKEACLAHELLACLAERPPRSVDLGG